MESVQAKIQRLKTEKNAVILAHYYVPDEVQSAADFVGDSFYLAKVAAETKADVLVFCGVQFMGESAKVLNPDKKVLLPELSADCPMAHMASIGQIEELKKSVPDLAVVCYINSTAQLKAHCDVCVTSSNALKIVRALKQKNILFIPDDNLGHYIASFLPEKKFFFCGGCCPIHANLRESAVLAAKAAHPRAEVLAHPECRAGVLALASYTGSTAGIIEYAKQSASREFIVCTENGVLFELKNACPEKFFYTTEGGMCCPDMKTITLDKVLSCLESGCGEVTLAASVAENALRPLKAMLEIAERK